MDKTVAEVRGAEPATSSKPDDKVPPETATQPAEGSANVQAQDKAISKTKATKDSKKRASTKQKKSKKRRTPVKESSSSSEDSDGSTDSSNSSSSDSDDSDSESEVICKKRSTKKRGESHKSKTKAKAKKQKKPTKQPPSPSASESDLVGLDKEDYSDEEPVKQMDLAAQLNQLQLMQLQQGRRQGGSPYQLGGGLGGGGRLATGMPPAFDNMQHLNGFGGARGGRRPRLLGRNNSMDPSLLLDRRSAPLDRKLQPKSNGLDFKRVDQVWDNTIHNYKLQDTAERTVDSQYDEFLFHVRRTFDWEGKYKATIVDIKSKLLRECLREVMGSIKGVSLVEETPKLDPNMLFLYLDDLRKHLKVLKKAKPTEADRKKARKEQKRTDLKRQHLKVLVKYIDKDYAEIKKSLYPMLENGLITFDLIWALWKPNTLAFTNTYGSHDEPRVFKVDIAEKHYGLMRGEYYYLEGKYFEYDGKQFGYGTTAEEIEAFRGARRITSLGTYPLQYHKNEEQARKDLIERGKKFVQLSGVHYMSHQGMAYYKKKKSVIKVNINGRIMVDASIHRRINPNYPISMVRPKDHDTMSDDEYSDESGCGCDSDWGDDLGPNGERGIEKLDNLKIVTKAVQDAAGKVSLIRVAQAGSEDATKGKAKIVEERQNTEGDDGQAKDGSKDEGELDDETKPPVFSDEEYLTASSVVLGFAFAEKLWLEFTVSGVKDIQWNETAYQSLVLETKTKDIVKALVESHKYHAAESIDDVIQGKGKGLVAVLHGPPGTGKTLTAEGISELLKCPLYMVSAGELGTDSRFLESELQKILDICHAWGAILLLDEADVFLEKRNMHDIHRNALVSIFLRQLEYFQGILFLTTNRVETFDDAFQSRIHIALRYDNLDQRAKKAIFKIFVERVRQLEKQDMAPFSEEDYNVLSRHELNGRQIKNTVRTAQALAINKGEPLAMHHIRQVLEVQMNFDRDLKGGTGYQDAMRSYF